MVSTRPGGGLGTFGSHDGRAIDRDERPIPVPPGLRPWVAGISVWDDRHREGPWTVIELPDPAATLVLRAGADGYSDLAVTGPRTRALYHVGESGPSCVKLRIQPGRARHVLGQPVNEIVDRAMPLGANWGEDLEQLAGMLADLGTAPEPLTTQLVLDRFQAAALGRIPPDTGGDRPSIDVAHMATRILTNQANMRVERMRAIAWQLGVSERYLRSLFHRDVGLSPKRVASIYRVRAVLVGVHRKDLAQLALETGYYDQSHMTAEFSRVMGVSPRAFAEGRLPAATPCSQHAPIEVSTSAVPRLATTSTHR